MYKSNIINIFHTLNSIINLRLQINAIGFIAKFIEETLFLHMSICIIQRMAFYQSEWQNGKKNYLINFQRV